MANGLIHTFTGKFFYPLDPTPETIDIQDIGHALSNQCRFNGHTSEFYSIAQHSVLVSRCVPTGHKLAALLHDASETYLPDVSRTIKPLLNGYTEVEQRLEQMIADKYGFEYPLSDEVIWADNNILRDEALAFFPRYQLEDWPYISTLEGTGIEINPWNPGHAKEEFISVAKGLILSGG
jgi:hypothetical protein